MFLQGKECLQGVSLTKSQEISQEVRIPSLFKSVFKQNINFWDSLSIKSQQISLLSHVTTLSTNQNAIHLQVLWENERFYPKKFPFK